MPFPKLVVGLQAIHIAVNQLGQRRRRGKTVQPGTYFTFQTGHILYTFGPVFRFGSSSLLVLAAEAVGMWESLVLGFPHFHRLIIGRQIFLPEPLNLQFARVEAGNR